MNHTQTNHFNLVEYLAADLHRANQLKNLQPSSQDLIFWLGILAPRFIPILLYRLSFLFYTLKLGIIAKLFSLLNFFLFGIEIAVNCQIGKGLFLPHTQGTVIGAWKIGENATIFQGVTIGAKHIDFSYLATTRPSIGNNVIIGSGAKVLGGISLADNCSIGANAVVLNDVSANQFAAGVPAKIIKNNNSD
jgi:serine O-acetyltransferase